MQGIYVILKIRQNRSCTGGIIAASLCQKLIDRMQYQSCPRILINQKSLPISKNSKEEKPYYPISVNFYLKEQIHSQ